MSAQVSAPIQIGEYKVTAFSDGLYQTSLDVTLDALKPDAQRISGRKLEDPVYLAVNAFLIEGKGVRALVDAGSGDTMGPALGKLPDNLRDNGVALDSITHVLLTHIHPDHSNGLIDGAGNAWFPKADVAVQSTEFAFWCESELSRAANDRQRRNMERARAALAPYAKRTARISDGEFLPGIRAQSAPGHTPGHTAWFVESGKESLVIWGDLIHMGFLQFERPDIAFIFDMDVEQAIKSRRALLDQASADRIRVAGMHLDFPGFGYVTRKREGYALEG